MADTRLSVGFVAGLDYRDPMFDPHVAFQQFKLHPFVTKLLRDGQMIRYGAKALPEGGWWALPECAHDGVLLVGDAAGFLNSLRLKGIHLAMKTGMLAADVAFDAVTSRDTTAAKLVEFDDHIRRSWVGSEMRPVRNVRQAFQYGLFAGLAFAGFSIVTRGWWIRPALPTRPGHERMRRINPSAPGELLQIKPD